MENISSLVNNSSLASFAYYSGAIILAVFFAGWFLNSRLHKICAENSKDLEINVKEIEIRLGLLEKEAVKVYTYEKDMEKVIKLVHEIKDDVKDGINSVTARIDTLSLLFTRDQYGSRGV